ncbi:MAG: hypothetical protein ACHQRM_17505 [Bacteroidia bacterium]
MKKQTSKSHLVEEFSITGKVTSINVKGYSPNSAQLLFSVSNGKTGESQTIRAGAYPGTEPQVFSAMATFVTMAHFLDKTITAGYYKVAGETNYAIEVYSPAAGKKSKKKSK